MTPPPSRSGLVYAILAYGLWGILPAYFLLMAPAGAIEIVGWRILFSLVFCAVLITATRAWPAFLAVLRRPKLVLVMGLAGHLILVNWTIYVYGTLNGHVLETALGYFINPIVTVLLGVFLLHERLRPLQWTAVGLSALAVVVLTVNYGALPWISLVLAGSFGLYGLLKKRIGGTVDALTGLTLETAWLTPAAVGMVVFVSATSGITLGTESPLHTIAILSAGVITAVPLLFFAAAARRLPLTYIGLTQYLAPVLQFLFGVFVMHEDMPAARWVGFSIVWVALIVLTIDMFASGRPGRRTVAVPA
ncbi:EamA family transporter RarD [Planctomonas psychrotolerans]|uniref:EamA family transporter RarD n=1 Tax=Planctomonas psychrotolerans TaxID=2528712 RepID=UPI001238F6F7|nr:EamA family transporter RarD [Planctomonas psychrotolerans]